LYVNYVTVRYLVASWGEANATGLREIGPPWHACNDLQYVKDHLALLAGRT
jgi:hypothetical protein